RYFYTGVTEPSEGQPAFVAVGEVDGQIIDRYDSEMRRDEPRAAWMQQEGQEYWDRQTQILHGTQQVFHDDLDTLQKRYNQSGDSPVPTAGPNAAPPVPPRGAAGPGAAPASRFRFRRFATFAWICLAPGDVMRGPASPLAGRTAPSQWERGAGAGRAWRGVVPRRRSL
ncbi:PREDICTED: BOLA class I histocompatibility antigen, alpha chain BL3-7-like, partial [Tinamus guttatus]|uniref:BOLA class I histocompatibility antigen, alpha chain BL3-7-like n=1 Tax=Tinamus guttatus TaxID=94827 RepID=UPI00052F402B